MGHVTCGICHKKYKAIFAGSKQGIKCAAEVSGGRLIGHYGSEVADMDAFTFVKTPPKEGTIICDNCITKALSSGEIKKIEASRHMLSDHSNALIAKLLSSRR